MAATATPQIHLRHPDYEGLVFGDGPDTIKFGLRGGFAPGHAWVPEDHPLLPALLEKHKRIEIVLPDHGPAKTWLCPIHPEREFRTKGALLAHLRAEGHGEAFAGLVAELEVKEAAAAESESEPEAQPVAAEG